MKKLIFSSLMTFLLGSAALGLLLFLPAWTLNYWRAWVFIVVFGLSTSAIGIYLSLKDPELLERRKQFGPAAEQSPVQKIIISLSVVGFLGMMVFSAFDYRFGWSPVPASISLLGDALVALGLLVDLFVFGENSYGASNVKTFEGQQVISTGFYGIVRHPMYLGVLIMCIGVPLALGSWWGLAVLALTIPVLVLRILDEERLLRKDLPGYDEYTRKVKHRLVPYLW